MGCQKQFNGRSGRKVEKAIRLYTLAAVLLLAFVAAWAIYEYAATQTSGGGKGTAAVSVS